MPFVLFQKAKNQKTSNVMSNLVKQQIVEFSRRQLDERITEVEKQGKSLQEGVAGESKSSAGDKHETARAMMNLEQEKLGRQYQELLNMKEVFEKIDFHSRSSAVKLGSLIITNKGKFLLSIGWGKVVIQNEDVLLLSSQSPLGEVLLGKTVGDKIQMNTNQYIIEDVI